MQQSAPILHPPHWQCLSVRHPRWGEFADWRLLRSLIYVSVSNFRTVQFSTKGPDAAWKLRIKAYRGWIWFSAAARDKGGWLKISSSKKLPHALLKDRLRRRDFGKISLYKKHFKRSPLKIFRQGRILMEELRFLNYYLLSFCYLSADFDQLHDISDLQFSPRKQSFKWVLYILLAGK